MRKFRFRLRTMLVTVTALSVAFAYVGSYYRLSRNSMRQAVDYGLPGILYVDFDEEITARDISWHYGLVPFYAPANWIDRLFFGGKPPMNCFMRLSG